MDKEMRALRYYGGDETLRRSASPKKASIASLKIEDEDDTNLSPAVERERDAVKSAPSETKKTRGRPRGSAGPKRK